MVRLVDIAGLLLLEQTVTTYAQGFSLLATSLLAFTAVDGLRHPIVPPVAQEASHRPSTVQRPAASA